MSQPGFFDIAERYAALDRKSDPLSLLNKLVPWEEFRADLERVWREKTEPRKSAAGRKAWDAVVIFKALILADLYNLSDDQAEYQMRDRLSFVRFLGLGLEDTVPDAKTLWLYREKLIQAKAVEGLFARFDTYLTKQGFLAMGGQIVDATIVPVPRQRNKRDENEQIKAGEVPAAWAEQPSKARQKDTDARWTKKHGKSHFGYKNHVSIDARHKLIRRYAVTNAAVHDSQKLEDVLHENTASDVWADSAYRAAETEAMLKERGLRSRIHRKAHRNRPLTKREQQGNRTKSRTRARVEHVFGHIATAMGGATIRCIGLARATARIGLRNLVYNMQRFGVLNRTTAPA